MTRLSMLSNLCAILAAVAIAAGTVNAQTIAITGGKVYTVSGEPIDGATIVIDDGMIRSVATAIDVPDGATVIDAGGKWVTPGLIDASTTIGLIDLGYTSDESSYDDDDVSAAFDVRPSINPQSILIPETRLGGVTTVFSAPSGGIVSGRGVILDLMGDNLSDMEVDASSIMVGRLTERTRTAGHGSRAGAYGRLRRLLQDARLLNERRADFEKNAMQVLSAPREDVEAMVPVALGEEPLMIAANRQSDIENALRLQDEFGLNLMISGVREGWIVADTLAARGVPVVVGAIDNIPTFDALSTRFEGPALLSKAGARISLTNGLDSGDSYNVRNLRFAAGNAVAYGMDWNAALRAVTLSPAEALGIADRYGSLEEGKVANVVVWSGDPFELSTAVEHVLIHGKEVPMTSRQKELLARYKEKMGL